MFATDIKMMTPTAYMFIFGLRPNPKYLETWFMITKGSEYRRPYEPRYGHRCFRLYRKILAKIGEPGCKNNYPGFLLTFTEMYLREYQQKVTF